MVIKMISLAFFSTFLAFCGAQGDVEARNCTGGVSGIENLNLGICCPTGCGQCGGSGCEHNGLPNYNSLDCCPGHITASEVYCDTPGAIAPCIIGSVTEAPSTEMPTPSPTDMPTPSPTEMPTPSPTEMPTPSPTEMPTPSPTEMPTPSPTDMPTPSPTEMPTPSPTEMPTPSPTEVPTPSPTVMPTPSPTDVPTPSPTELSTYSPTEMATPSSRITAPARNCTGGVSGIENLNLGICCPTGCGQCGGSGCEHNGLPNYNSLDCCPTHIIASEVYCDTPGAIAPCIIGSDTEAPSTEMPTPSPTEMPTPSPTEMPTPSPTEMPTPSPTEMPTPSPTEMPTPSPTEMPTPSPTDMPTPSPTEMSTPSPTDMLTPSPTEMPTPSPTEVPTPSPTEMPTPSPTDVPTPSPTELSTYSPTEIATPPSTMTAPARNCTGGVSGIENLNLGICCPTGCGQCGGSGCEHNGLPNYNSLDCCPTHIVASEVYCDTPGAMAPCIIGSVTEAPSTEMPTPSPTEMPTPSPTEMPTPSPTEMPTPSPTEMPTPSPTEMPTPSPTEMPTPSPTQMPTPSPTEMPTPSPTEVPTPSPTEVPTPSPTEMPTPSPTEIPTPSPTEMPTPSPTEMPTPSPTEMPTPSPIRTTPVNWCLDLSSANGGCGSAISSGSTRLDVRSCGISDNDLADLSTCIARVNERSGGIDEIWLGSNALTTVPQGIFDDLSSLEYLSLVTNALTTLPSGIFDSLSSLDKLDLSHNELEALPPGIFDRLGSLTVLWLGSNALATVPLGIFDSLSSLKTLELFKNGLTTLPEGIFDSLPLTRLHLYGNPDLECLPTVPSTVTDLPVDDTVGTACGCDLFEGTNGLPSDPCVQEGLTCTPGYKGYTCEIPTPGYEEVGCYTDKGDARIMVNQMISEDSMTAKVCQAHCVGSIYFGVQFGQGCWCDTATGEVDYPFDLHGVSTGCTMRCSGNHAQTCGGTSAMEVYMNIPEIPKPVYEKIGCYTDKGDTRIMVNRFASYSMTVEICQAHCVGSIYFGLQAHQGCWCDNATGEVDYPFDVHGVSTGCTLPCAGNQAETCGGHWAMEVYMNIPGYEEVGCYTDKGDARIMVNRFASDSMTVEICQAHCVGSIYFGLQAHDGCWCDTAAGEVDYPFDVHGVSTGCTMGCAGNQAETCGGGWAMEVYMNIPGMPTLDMDATPSTTEMPTPSPTMITPGYEEVGCYTDGPERIMVNRFASDSMTVEVCQAHCVGSIYFGLQFGQGCWCDTATGEVDYPFDVHGVSTDCTMPCSGNQEQTCGGLWAMEVYMNIN